MLKEIDYNDGEIHTWSGGKCPIHQKSVVDVSYGGRWILAAKAADLYWFKPLLFRITKQHIEPVAPPKPLELWVNVYADGRVMAYKTADIAASWLSRTGRTIRVIEVLEDV